MELLDILEQILVDEPNSNIGYILNNDEVIQELANVKIDFDFINLKNYNLDKKTEFIGEFFENLILEIDDNLLQNINFLKEITRIIQKNRLLILITDLDILDVEKQLEPFHWTDFSEISFSDKKIIIAKKWFQI
jgi:hypothetical protein